MVLDQLYATVARERRRWYVRRPDRRRRLNRPVVSVGNVAAGGSGKTPLVAHIARLLQDAGHRPAILTRGYARARPSDGVTVVSDGERLLADLDRAGDEPLMLARQLPSVPVLVSSDRYLSGRLAERHFGCTVHLLDDGFQHVQLERDVDLVLVSGDDLARPVTLPSGRLREPLDAVRKASAVILSDVEPAQAGAAPGALGGATVFRLTRESGPARPVEPDGKVVPPAAGTRVLAVAGLARPERFFADLGGQGWTVAGTLAFGDHHRYTRADLERIAAAMRAAGAALAVTTEKDLVRMLPLRPLPAPVWWVPLRVSVEPAAEFAAWLNRRIGLVVSGQLPVGSGQSATRDQLRTQDSELRTQNSELRTQN
jgi:tetraacyldisaccharide 4'-kinase